MINWVHRTSAPPTPTGQTQKLAFSRKAAVSIDQKAQKARGYDTVLAVTFSGADHVSAFLQERLDVLRVVLELLLVERNDLAEAWRVQKAVDVLQRRKTHLGPTLWISGRLLRGISWRAPAIGDPQAPKQQIISVHALKSCSGQVMP